MSEKMNWFKPRGGSGDRGNTTLADGSKIKKGDARIRACASIDELICILGACKARIRSCRRGGVRFLAPEIEEIQNHLTSASALIAGTDRSDRLKEAVLSTERRILELSKELKPMRKFAVPGRNPVEASLHLSRSFCRSAEISVWRTRNARPAAVYLNRLSDLLFLMAEKAVC